MELAFLGSVDEPEVIVRIDLQPVQDRGQGTGNAARLAFDDGATGPVNQFKVVSAFVRDGALQVIARLVGKGRVVCACPDLRRLAPRSRSKLIR